MLPPKHNTDFPCIDDTLNSHTDCEISQTWDFLIFLCDNGKANSYLSLPPSFELAYRILFPIIKHFGHGDAGLINFDESEKETPRDIQLTLDC